MTGWREIKEGDKNRQLKTTREGEINYASVGLEGRRKLIWRGGDARLIPAPFISKSDLFLPLPLLC